MLSEKELKALQESITTDEDLFFKGVLYGEFGTRKTTTALRCMRDKAILLHADRGWQVIHNHPEEFKPGENVIPVAYQGLSQVRAILEARATGVEPFKDTDLFIWDTMSQSQERYIDFLMENAEYSGKFRESLIPKAGIKSFEKTEIPGMPDYHLARNKMRPIVDLLVQAPMNVIFLAHLREPGPIERAAGKLEKRPNITEALYKVVARDATFIGLMRNEKGDYHIDFEPKNTQSAKSQIPELTSKKKIKATELPDILRNWSNQ